MLQGTCEHNSKPLHWNGYKIPQQIEHENLETKSPDSSQQSEVILRPHEEEDLEFTRSEVDCGVEILVCSALEEVEASAIRGEQDHFRSKVLTKCRSQMCNIRVVTRKITSVLVLNLQTRSQGIKQGKAGTCSAGYVRTTRF